MNGIDLAAVRRAVAAAAAVPELRPAIAAQLHEAFSDDPVRTLKEVREVALTAPGFIAPVPVTHFDREPRNVRNKYVALVTQPGPTTVRREIDALDDPAEMLRRFKAEGTRASTLTRLAVQYAAQHQLDRVPMYRNHADGPCVRTAAEEFGFITHPWCDPVTGCVFACVNVRRDAMQSEFQRRLRQGEALPLSIAYFAYWGAGLDVLLFKQITAVDLVGQALTPRARVLGPWADRAALLKAEADEVGESVLKYLRVAR